MLKSEKGIFAIIPLELYKRMEKVRVDEDINQRKFINKIIKDYVERKEAKKC